MRCAPFFPTLHPVRRTESSGPSSGSRCAVGARLPCGRNEASTRAQIPELKTEEPQARDQRGAQAWGWGRRLLTGSEGHPQKVLPVEGGVEAPPRDSPPRFPGFLTPCPLHTDQFPLPYGCFLCHEPSETRPPPFPPLTMNPPSPSVSSRDIPKCMFTAGRDEFPNG